MFKNKFCFISWQQFHDVCFFLIKILFRQRIKFDRIICISRGGLIASRILSDFLDLPISPFTIVGYTSIQKNKKPQIVEKLRVDIKNEAILLVDEVCDTGETFLCGLNYLKKFGPKKIYTLAPFIKTTTKYQPDYWQIKTNKWIIFPYEIRETIEALKAMFIKQGYNDLQIIDKLKKMKLPKNYVNFYLRKNSDCM